MARFSKQEKAEWVKNAKAMEKDCSNRIKEIAKNYVRDPKTIVDALAFGSRFYNYSRKNMQLIFSQNPSALYVQSFPAWKKMGYSVKKGQKGLKVWAPVKTTLLHIGDEYIKLSDASKQQKEAYHKGEIEGRETTRFMLGSVFDIAQTTYPPEKYPELFSVGYPSSMHNDICKGLIDYAQDYVHFDVKVNDLSSITLRGYCSPGEKQIVLNSSLADTQKLSTMSHELGHAIRHSLGDGLSTCRKEFEADSLSIMIESGFGLEQTDSRKAHLCQHFNAYCDELKTELGENFNEEILEDKVNEVLSSVYGTYAACIDNINKCVEQYVPKERLLEYERKQMAKKLEIKQDKDLDQGKEKGSKDRKLGDHEMELDC